MMKGMMTIVVVKELLWLFVVVMTVMVSKTHQQQQQQSATEFPSSLASSLPPLLSPPPPPPPSASLPADGQGHGRHSSGPSGGAEEVDEADEGHQLNTMTTFPSEDDDDEEEGGGGLTLATGDTAILECRIPAAAAAAAAPGRNKNLSWTNTLTKTKMTNNITAFQNTSLTSVESNETMSLILTMTNVTVAKNEFTCELDVNQNLQMKRTVKVTVLSSDSLCTFEGETTGVWKVGNVWTREHSVSAASSQPASCDAAGFSDHTYGNNNANGHFLMARVTDDRQVEGATLNATVRNATQCIRFYYKTCVTNESRGGGGAMVQLMSMTIIGGISSPPILINLSLALDWTEHRLILPPRNREQQHEIVLSFSFANASDFNYIAIDDIRMEDDICEPANQQVTQMESVSESRSLWLQAPTSVITTNTLVTTAGSSQSSTSKATSTSEISSSATTTTATQPTSSTTTTTTPTTTPTKTSSSALPPTVAMIQPTVASTSARLASSSLLSATSRQTPDDSEDSIRPTDYDRSSAVAAAAAAAAAAVDEAETAAGADDASDDGTAGAEGAGAAAGDNSTGLAIGIILAIMVAGACTAAILYRRRKNGKKSTYITFGNPSYSREHLPVNDFGLDSPLTLSSNGYTVLA